MYHVKIISRIRISPCVGSLHSHGKPRNRVLSPNNRFRNGLPPETLSNIEVRRNSTCAYEEWMCRKRVKSRKQAWMWFSDFDNGRTDVVDKYPLGRSSLSTIKDNVLWANTLIKEDRHITMTATTRKLNISLGTAHSNVHVHLDYRSCVHSSHCTLRAREPHR